MDHPRQLGEVGGVDGIGLEIDEPGEFMRLVFVIRDDFAGEVLLGGGELLNGESAVVEVLFQDLK